MKRGEVAFWSLLGLVVVLVLGWGVYVASQPGKLNSFAQCLKDKGAVFYGAYWCPHCQATKALFGKSAALLPYVECSTPDGQGQLEICKDKKIDGYPTWDFANGHRLTGELALDELANETGCILPQ